MSTSVGRQMVRTTGLFQAVVAFPPMFMMGWVAMESLLLPQIHFYDFITSTFIALFAGGIIFTVVVQHNVNMSKTITLYFEAAKSGLATAVWLWLLLDTIFGPELHSWYYYNGQRPRIVRAAISGILLFILYYPTLIYAIVEKRYDEAHVLSQDREAEAGQDQGERQPLLT